MRGQTMASEDEIRAIEDLLDVPTVDVIDDIEAATYTIGTDIDGNEARVAFHNHFGILSTFTTDAAGLYEFAQRLLRAYDKLEGL
jgi:hypothetical protein